MDTRFPTSRIVLQHNFLVMKTFQYQREVIVRQVAKMVIHVAGYIAVMPIDA